MNFARSCYYFCRNSYSSNIHGVFGFCGRNMSSKQAEMGEDEIHNNYEPLFDKNLLKDKVAFITGGGSGIGFTITEIFMRHGCRTVIASRDVKKLQRSADKLQRATGGRCLAVSIDVRKPNDIVAAVDAALAEFGRLDILVNNAAGNFLCPLSGMSYNAFKTVMEIDAHGTFNASKTAYDKYFRAHGGVIVNISATLHYNGAVFQAHAGAAKASIDALTKHMAAEWGQDRVRIVGIAPGPIKSTTGFDKLGGLMATDEMIQSNIPLQRAGTRLDIAQAALYLASDAASYVTGHTLVVDGGQWLSPRNSMKEAEKIARALAKASKL